MKKIFITCLITFFSVSAAFPTSGIYCKGGASGLIEFATEEALSEEANLLKVSLTYPFIFEKEVHFDERTTNLIVEREAGGTGMETIYSVSNKEIFIVLKLNSNESSEGVTSELLVGMNGEIHQEYLYCDQEEKEIVEDKNWFKRNRFLKYFFR